MKKRFLPYWKHIHWHWFYSYGFSFSLLTYILCCCWLSNIALHDTYIYRRKQNTRRCSERDEWIKCRNFTNFFLSLSKWSATAAIFIRMINSSFLCYAILDLFIFHNAYVHTAAVREGSSLLHRHAYIYIYYYYHYYYYYYATAITTSSFVVVSTLDSNH